MELRRLRAELAWGGCTEFCASSPQTAICKRVSTVTSVKHNISDELISALLADYKKSVDPVGENGLLMQLTKAVIEKALQAELNSHLGHECNEAITNGSRNSRNGSSKKMLKGEFGELPIEIPQDRNGSLKPQLASKQGCDVHARLVQRRPEVRLHPQPPSGVSVLGAAPSSPGQYCEVPRALCSPGQRRYLCGDALWLHIKAIHAPNA